MALIFSLVAMLTNILVQIARETLTDTVNKINELLERSEELGCPTYTEGCLSCLTGYLLYFCIETKYSKVTIVTYLRYNCVVIIQLITAILFRC